MQGQGAGVMSILKLSVIPISNFKLWAAFAILLSLGACSQSPEQSPENPKAAVPGQMTEFAGTWNAMGNRRSIALGKNRRGSIIELKGTMLLTGSARPAVGFRAELIALVDSETGLIGRSVWTDERGDQVFSEVKGEGDASTNRIVGTFLGGTGRFADVTGGYEYSWQFVIEAEDGSIQGRAVGLKGHARLDKTASGGAAP
jgi:hypothetical protein